MALDPGIGYPSAAAQTAVESNRRRRRRRKRPTPSLPLTFNRGADSAEAARFTRSPTFDRIRAGARARSPWLRPSFGHGSSSSPEAQEARRQANLQAYRTQALAIIAEAEQRLEADADAGRIDGGTYAHRKQEIQGAKLELAQSSFGGLNVFDRFTRDLMETVVYTPAGVYEGGKAVVLDTRDFVTSGDVTPERTAGLGEAMGRQVVEDLSHPLQHPGYALLDLWAIGSLGAGGVSRVSAASRAARMAGEAGTSPLRAALTRPPSEGGSLLRRPAPERMEIAPGVSVNLSPNPLAAMLQRQRVRQGLERPESRFAGDLPGRNLHERVGFERRRDETIRADIDRAEAEGLRARGRKLGDVEERAIMVVGEGTPIAERIALHEQDLAKAEGSGISARLRRRRISAELDLLRRVRDSGLVEEVGGRPAPSARLREMYERTVASGARREGILEELGLASEDQLAARRAAPARVFAGAEFEQRPAVSARREHVREYELPGREEVRPRTEAEARERLAELDAAYERTVAGIMDTLSGGVHDAGEQARRNLYKRRLRGKKRGQPRLPTVKQELRRMAEEELDRIVTTRAGDPEVARVASLLDERARLRESLNDPEVVFGGASIPTSELGTIRYTVPGETIRRRFSGRKAEAAVARLVGGEDLPAGELFVSYRRTRRMPFGRAQMGTAQGLGIPRQNLLGGRFTGEAIHQGRVPGDVVERVAEGELEAQRHKTVLRLREQAVAESIDANALLALPESEAKHYRPVRISGKPYSVETKAFVDSLQAKVDEGRTLTREERAELESRTEKARAYFFPGPRELDRDSALAAAELNEVRFFDARHFGGLERPQQPITGLGKSFQTFFDEFNSARDLTDLMLRVGYGPANLASQIALTISAGVGPADLQLAVRLSRRLTPEQRAKVRGASGLGLAEGMPRVRGRIFRPLRNKLARQWGRILDDPWRLAAFAKYARQAGYGTPAKVARLLNDPALEGELLAIAKRTRDAMLDYERMGRHERNILSRAIRFWPFLKSSGVFTGKFVRDNPVQAAVVMQLALEAKGEAEEEIGPVPFYRRGIFSVGEDEQGNPLVVDPRAAQLFDAPVQAAQIVEGLATGIGAEFGLADPEEAEALREQIVPGDLVSPAVRLGLDFVDPRDRFTGEELTFGEAFRRNQLQTPQTRLAQAFLDPERGDQSERQFPTGPETELHRYLAGGIWPRSAHRRALNEAAAEEERSLLSDAELRELEVDERIAEARRTAQAAGEQLPPQYATLVRRRALYDAAVETMEDELETDHLTLAQRTLALISVANHTPEIAGESDEYTAAWQDARGNPLDEGSRPNGPMNYLYNALHNALFGELEGIDRWLEQLRDTARMAAGA
jgi:hypothetical protein